jgi:Leucine-rich repeat (LRR) protein
MDAQVHGNCLFDKFQQITILDISSVQFEPITNNTEIYLTHLLRCKTQTNGSRRGEQLIQLYLRQLQLQRLPEWFTNDRFPRLSQLDLSNNNIYSIDLNTYSNLLYISLAYNPIELHQIVWGTDTNYGLINLSSTIRNRTYDLSHRLKNLLKLTTNIDFSNNEGNIPANITNIPLAIDFPRSQFLLNLSRTNIYSFQSNWNDLLQLDISFNNLTELNLAEQVKLNYLDCSNQFIEKLGFSEVLSDLIELKCSNNSLITIENFSFVKNTQLKVIDLSNNRINSLEKLFGNLSSRYLHIINLKSNLIEMIPSNIFHQNLISLFEINLSWNRIHTIKNNAFQSPNLQILDLTGNLLKNIEPNAILTSSLRLFFIFNNTQQLIDRCVKSKSNDTLLSIYMPWFRRNGTYMQNKQIYNNKQIQSNKCLTRYKSQSKMLSTVTNGKHSLGYSTIFITMGAVSLIGILFGGIVYYRKNGASFLAPFRRYKKLDRQNLVENAAEMDQQQREDDEIVMNLDEAPYNTFTGRATNV